MLLASDIIATKQRRAPSRTNSTESGKDFRNAIHLNNRKNLSGHSRVNLVESPPTTAPTSKIPTLERKSHEHQQQQQQQQQQHHEVEQEEEQAQEQQQPKQQQLAKQALGVPSNVLPSQLQAEEELFCISQAQAIVAFELTQPAWDVLGLQHTYEDPTVKRTLDSCIQRVTALLWIRFIAIGFGAAYSSVIDDLSTSTICRKLLEKPKQQPRNPQDVDDDHIVSSRMDSDATSTQKQKKGPLKLSCWWWKGQQLQQQGTFIMPSQILEQLRRYVRYIFQLHFLDLPFHNYTHAAAVVIRCNKLLDMILCTTEEVPDKYPNDDDVELLSNSHHSLRRSNSSHNYDDSNNNINIDDNQSYYYDEDFDFGQRNPPTFGLRIDPVLQASLLFAALIHDVSHQGVTNRQLSLEEHPLAVVYNDQSIQERNSLKVAFEEFNRPVYIDLRNAMFGTKKSAENDKYRTFRNTIVNAVLTTDIASPEQTVVTKTKWKEAFGHYRRNHQQQSNHGMMLMETYPQQQNFHPHQYQQPLQPDRRFSTVSDISMPNMPRSNLGFSPAQLSGKQPFNRRGSNVSEVSEDSYMRGMKQIFTRRGSNNSVNGPIRLSVQQLGTVMSQRLLQTADDDDEFEFGDDEEYDYLEAQQRKHQQLPAQYRANANRRDTSSPSSYMMQTKSPRPLSNRMQPQQRRYSNESYPMNDDPSFDASEFANDSTIRYRQQPMYANHAFTPPSRANRRMSSGSYVTNSSYSASEWGGDSIQHYRNHQAPAGSRHIGNEVRIQNHRYQHQQENNIDQSVLNRSSSTLLSLSSYGNSIEVTRKRLEEDSPNTSINVSKRADSALKKTVMMQSDEGEPIDISRYVYNGKEDGDSSSFSETTPSSVEDEYGRYAKEYAAQFKTGTMNPLTAAATKLDKNNINLSPKGEYCGRVIVATTTTNRRIDRRSSASGAITFNNKGRQLVVAHNNFNLNMTTSNGHLMHNNLMMSNSQPPQRRMNRRASTGTVPVRFMCGPTSSLLQSSIDENNSSHDQDNLYPILSNDNNNSGPLPRGSNTRRRRSLGMVNAPCGGGIIAISSSDEVGDDIKKFKKRLGIRRSMDLSGESIEIYARHDDDNLTVLTHETDENINGNNEIDYDEPDELRAAVVIEALLRVADVGHCVQNWENMIQWSSKLFHELHNAHEAGRSTHNPATGWYENQIQIMDSYLRPLALQLDEMGIFGEFDGVLFLHCIAKIRQRWIVEGKDITDKLRMEAETRKTSNTQDLMRFI